MVDVDILIMYEWKKHHVSNYELCNPSNFIAFGEVDEVGD